MQVTFSPDERWLTVSGPFVPNAGRRLDIRRPLSSPWNYVSALTLWVAVWGSDSGDGSPLRPFATVQHAVNVAQAQAGSVVYVMPGEYAEQVRITGGNFTLSCVQGGGLGSAVIRWPDAAPAGTPLVSLFGTGVQNVTINGLVLVGPMAGGLYSPPYTDSYQWCGLLQTNGPMTGVRVTNCVAYGFPHCGFKDMGGGNGYTWEGLAAFCNGGGASAGHGFYVPGKGATFNGNVGFLNGGYGGHFYSTPSNLTITRNLFFGNRAGGALLGCSGSTIKANTCGGGPFQSVGFVYYRGGCNNNAVQGNVSWGHPGYDVDYDNGGGKLGDPWGNSDDYNLWGRINPLVPGLVSPGGARATLGVNDLLGVDPMFVSPAAGDFSLKSGSLGIGTGPAGVNRGAF